MSNNGQEKKTAKPVEAAPVKRGEPASVAAKKTEAKPVVKPDAAFAAASVQAPVEMRGVIVGTDGMLVHIIQQTCNNLELLQIGQRLVETAQQRERAAIQTLNETKGAVKPKADA